MRIAVAVLRMVLNRNPDWQPSRSSALAAEENGSSADPQLAAALDSCYLFTTVAVDCRESAEQR
jgi:hypothetical protein